MPTKLLSRLSGRQHTIKLGSVFVKDCGLAMHARKENVPETA
jgi:hypothetical protein